MAAENIVPASRGGTNDAGFNEAAAHGRGKRAPPGGRGPGLHASMRPRRMAAENHGSRGLSEDAAGPLQ